MAGWPSSRGSSISAGAGQIGVADVDVDVEPFVGGGQSGCEPYSDTAVLVLVADDLGGHVIEIECQTVVEVCREWGAGNRDDIPPDGLDIVGCLQSREVDIRIVGRRNWYAASSTTLEDETVAMRRVREAEQKSLQGIQFQVFGGDPPVRLGPFLEVQVGPPGDG